MKLQLVGAEPVSYRGGERYRNIFETPSGQRVAKTGRGYYAVGGGGRVDMKRRYIGSVNGCEAWEYNHRPESVVLIQV